MFVRMGADLVCYSGKYFRGPNATGFVCGRKDLIEAVAGQSFVGPTEGWFGWGYKLDRQGIVALVVAVQRWMKVDHEKERFIPASERRVYLMNELKDIPDISFMALPDQPHRVDLLVTFNKKNTEEVDALIRKLREGDLPIWLWTLGTSYGNSIPINTLFLLDDDVKIIADRLKSLITEG
jgi:selenocysteine lyase/cysteine desulfurase